MKRAIRNALIGFALVAALLLAAFAVYVDALLDRLG